MDFRPDTFLPPLRTAGSLPLVVRAADEHPVPLEPLVGRSRRLPAPRAELAREPRRRSGRRRRSIAEVNAVIAPPIALPAPEPARDPSRWARFEALVAEAGVARERLLAAFPTAEDIEDIFHTPDAELPACAATIVRAILAESSSASGRAPAAGAAKAAAVRCADCRHYARSATHPRLGRCGAGVPATAAGGWWDTQRRSCDAFAARTPADPDPA